MVCVVVGTVGRLTPVKDQHTLLRALAELRSTRPALCQRVRVMIVGGGQLQQSLTELIDELNLGDLTWLTGDRDDVPALLSAMDIFVLPSLAEGISNTVLEAMASGLPVIATAVGGNLELVEQGYNGSLVPVGSPPALAAAMAELLENAAQRASQGAHARTRVSERFDWERTVAGYLRVYDELLRLPTDKTIESAG